MNIRVDDRQVRVPVESPEIFQADRLRGLMTPSYLYDPLIVVNAVRQLKALLGTGLVISLKANPDPDLYARCVHAFTDGVEVASLRELEVVTGSRIPCFVNNLSMNAELLRATLATRSVLIVDHLAQAEMLIAQARPGQAQPVLLRVNASSAGFRSSRDDHFGMSLDECIEAARRLAQAKIAVRGCHIYAGSNALKRTWRHVASSVASVVAVIEAAIGTRLQTINLGGGFAIDWRLDVDFILEYAATLNSLSASYELLHESGRGVFGAAGQFLTRVVAVKKLGDRELVVCDGGMAQNLLLSGVTSTIRRYIQPELLPQSLEPRRLSSGPIIYVGSSCNQDDVIGQGRAGSVVPLPGDMVFICDCGAYNQTFSVVDFLGLPKAHVYIGNLAQRQEASCPTYT